MFTPETRRQEPLRVICNILQSKICYNPYETRLTTASLNSPSVHYPSYVCWLTYQSTTHNHPPTHSIVKHLFSEPLIPYNTISYSPINFLAFSPTNYSLLRFIINLHNLSPVDSINYARAHKLISSPSLDQIIHLRSLPFIHTFCYILTQLITLLLTD
jgi:hypothetical protein